MSYAPLTWGASYQPRLHSVFKCAGYSANIAEGLFFELLRGGFKHCLLDFILTQLK